MEDEWGTNGGQQVEKKWKTADCGGKQVEDGWGTAEGGQVEDRWRTGGGR